jgi:hypothetical protein
MNISGSAHIGDGGISLRIVNFLGKYPSPIPIDFLAKELGYRAEVLRKDFDSLESKGVIRVDRESQTIALVEPKKSVLSTFFQWASGTQ